MNAYDITLTDTTTTATMLATEVPLTTTTLEGAVDVQTLSFNVYTDFIAQKRTWSHTWKYMTEDEYNALVGFYNRQFTLYQYPELTITEEGVDGVIVRMTMNVKNIIDGCGTVNDVSVTFRETRQLEDTGGVLLLDDPNSKLYVNNNEYLEL